MVELQPSKLVAWVRFPSPAPNIALVAQLDRAAVSGTASAGGSNPFECANEDTYPVMCVVFYVLNRTI